MNFKRFLSLFLAVLMLCSALTGLSVITVSAEETTTEASTGDEEETRIDYANEIFASPEDKLASMKLMTTKNGYAFYADEHSGEVAVKNLASGQVLFSNPYDVGAANASDSVKNEILSQIIVKFSENGREKTYTSYEYAALKDQIKVKNIKNGIRVEYTIGREEARMLVPHWIEKSRFEENIIAPLEEYYGVTYEEAKILKDDTSNPLSTVSFYLCKHLAYYVEKSLAKCSSDRLVQETLSQYPCTADMDIYVLDSSTTQNEKVKLEQIIKTACPNYSYEEMDADHQLTGYTSEDENPPLFKMSLEYKVDDEMGFTVRLPANGISYNESKFQITNISVLPYMGAGNNTYDGYTFYPDGSGALFAFEDLVDVNTTSVASKIYGVDYAYHKISGTYQQTVRYPVFGVVENTRYYDCLAPDEETGEDKITTINGMIYDAVMEAAETGTATAASKAYTTLVNNSEVEEYTVNNGYVAFIEEGDALTELVSYHAGVLSPYDTVQMNFNPRPKDSYNIQDAISVGTNSEWTVVTQRKYTGNYKVRYVMLTDETLAEENGLAEGSYYDTTWLGMAIAYRDYLVNEGVLTALSAEQTSGDIPLYIESFGAMETIEKILSVPVEVTKPLTSAQDVITMYEELSGQGVTNINFKLTGYANGGMYSTVPYGLKWEKAVSDEVSMQELFDYAAELESGKLGLYPEFDFSYAMETELFDGLSMRKHAVRTIDDRYTYKREYIATQQKYGGYYQMAISPAYFNHFYEKFMKNYLKYDNLNGISVGSLGNSLNSDFDEDEPYNREDSKGFVTKALDYISGEDDSMSIMVDGGNAYTWKYADHILGAALDSSRYIKASYSVPFVGVVLHGYKNFAGSPLNMEGDVNYAKLKAIENGASIYFTLSYQNTQNLKEDFYLNKYYSVRYDIWFDDVVEIYNELNAQLKDVQDKLIIDHQFLSGMRVPDTTELDRDITEEFNTVLDFQNNKAEYEEKQKNEAVADARETIVGAETAAKYFVENCITYYSGISGAAYIYVTGDSSYERRFATYIEANAAYKEIKAEYDAADAEGKAALADSLAVAEATNKQALGKLRTVIRNVGRAIATIESEYAALNRLLEDAQSGALLINSTQDCPQSIIDEITEQLANTEALMAKQLGLTFNQTGDKAEVDTFLHTHIATLLYTSYGETNHDTVGIVGKAENIYEMLANESYGLLITELDVLRYLPENRDMTDDELIAKYGLKEDETSMDGLILYVKELLGDKYTFDPVIAETEGGIEKNIRDYFVNMLHYILVSLDEDSLISSLNYVPTMVNEKGRIVTNKPNITAVNKQIDAKIAAALTTGKNSVLANVTDGNYKLDDLFSEADMNALVAECVEIIEKNIKTRENPNPENPVEYATPATMEADVRNYIESSYYYEVLHTLMDKDKIKSDTVKLQVMTVSYKTDSSMSLLADLRIDAYELDATTKYYSAIQGYKADTELSSALNTINNTIKGAYGDVRADLDTAYLVAFAKNVLGTDKEPALSAKTNADSTKLKNAANELINAKLATTTLATLDSLIAEVVALHDDYELKDSYDKNAASAEFVSYHFLKSLTGAQTNSYYYDEQLAKMDATVRAKVAEKKAAILADLPANYTVYQLNGKIVAALADAEDSAYDFAEAVAAEITYASSGKDSIEDDVFAYYCYLLYNAFDDAQLGDAPSITIEGDSTKVKNFMLIVDGKLADTIPELMAVAKAAVKRGELPDYSIESFMTEDDVNETVNGIIDALIASKFATEDDRAALAPEIKAYFQYKYYVAVLDKLEISKAPTISVSEIYDSNLYEASMNFKNLMFYYLTSMTDMTEADIDRLIGGSITSEEEDEDEEASRYLSDDGRIVSVTYGDKNADGSYSAYKTFILNYNNFSVNVEYEDVTYTIPAYGYVVVMHG